MTTREAAMQPAELREWRHRLHLTRKDAAQALGIGVRTLDQYELGRHHTSGDPRPIPRSIALACSALAFGLPPYSVERRPEPAAEGA